VIYVDYRERKSGVPELLERQGLPIKILELEVGDYIIGDVAVERKTIHDYLASKASGHLDRQLHDLSYNFELSYLIIEGYVGDALLKARFPRAAYISSLIGSSLKRAPGGEKGQVITINVETIYDTALALKALHDKLVKGTVVRLPKMQRAHFNSDEILVYVLSSFPGIGEVRARALLRRFGSFERLVQADVSELMEVPKINRKVANELYSLLHGKYGGE